MTAYSKEGERRWNKNYKVLVHRYVSKSMKHDRYQKEKSCDLTGMNYSTCNDTGDSSSSGISGGKRNRTVKDLNIHHRPFTDAIDYTCSLETIGTTRASSFCDPVTVAHLQVMKTEHSCGIERNSNDKKTKVTIPIRSATTKKTPEGTGAVERTALEIHGDRCQTTQNRNKNEYENEKNSSSFGSGNPSDESSDESSDECSAHEEMVKEILLELDAQQKQKQKKTKDDETGTKNIAMTTTIQGVNTTSTHQQVAKEAFDSESTDTKHTSRLGGIGVGSLNPANESVDLEPTTVSGPIHASLTVSPVVAVNDWVRSLFGYKTNTSTTINSTTRDCSNNLCNKTKVITATNDRHDSVDGTGQYTIQTASNSIATTTSFTNTPMTKAVNNNTRNQSSNRKSLYKKHDMKAETILDFEFEDTHTTATDSTSSSNSRTATAKTNATPAQTNSAAADAVAARPTIKDRIGAILESVCTGCPSSVCPITTDNNTTGTSNRISTGSNCCTMITIPDYLFSSSTSVGTVAGASCSLDENNNNLNENINPPTRPNKQKVGSITSITLPSSSIQSSSANKNLIDISNGIDQSMSGKTAATTIVEATARQDKDLVLSTRSPTSGTNSHPNGSNILRNQNSNVVTNKEEVENCNTSSSPFKSAQVKKQQRVDDQTMSLPVPESDSFHVAETTAASNNNQNFSHIHVALNDKDCDLLLQNKINCSNNSASHPESTTNVTNFNSDEEKVDFESTWVPFQSMSLLTSEKKKNVDLEVAGREPHKSTTSIVANNETNLLQQQSDPIQVHQHPNNIFNKVCNNPQLTHANTTNTKMEAYALIRQNSNVSEVSELTMISRRNDNNTKSHHPNTGRKSRTRQQPAVFPRGSNSNPLQMSGRGAQRSPLKARAAGAEMKQKQQQQWYNNASYNRIMAYYAVGQHPDKADGGENHTSNINSSKNRRCYFTGKLILGNAPYYAGCIDDGMYSTMVVFCLPSAVHLPDPKVVEKIYFQRKKKLMMKSKSENTTTEKKKTIGMTQRRSFDNANDTNSDPLDLIRSTRSYGETFSDGPEHDMIRNKNDMLLLDPNWNMDRNVLLHSLPNFFSIELLYKLVTLYKEQFETLPIQLRTDCTKWNLYIKFCSFSGLPIGQTEVHYKVKDSIIKQIRLQIMSTTNHTNNFPNNNSNNYEEEDIVTMDDFEIALSHRVVEASEGTVAADLLTIPNRNVLWYIQTHYKDQCDKSIVLSNYSDIIFLRSSWERIAPEV